MAEEVSATGTVGGVVPDGLAAVARGELVSKLGAAEFDTVSVRRGGVTASAEHVTAEPADGAVSVTADEGTADLPGRTLGLEGIDATLWPPEGGFPEAHRSAFARLRGLAADGSLSLSAVRTTLSESGVTVSDTLDAVGNVRFDAAVEKVAEGGVTLVSDFRSRGTLAELLPALRGGGAPDGDGAAGDSLDEMVVVEHPNPEGVEGPDDYVDYVFEVTGDLEKLEPNEDRRHARDRVTRRGDRTRVEGSVGTGDDRFAFSGTLREVDTDGVRITVSQR